MSAPPPRIAILGCGAVAEIRYLPALAKLKIKPTLLVDRDVQRAQRLADAYGCVRASDDYRPWVDEFDAAIVALPHSLHAPVSVDLLQRGVHVLVEKPMALTTTECDQLIAAASEQKAILAVGLMRRHAPAARWLKAALDAHTLGPIESFDFQEGVPYTWPVVSGFFFDKTAAGGGVLADTGAHTLDLLLWWLGDVASFEYYDDAYGGVEADALLRVTLASGVRGVVELSRTRRLRNTAVLRGREGEIEIGLAKQNNNFLTARPKTVLSFRAGRVRGTPMRRLKTDDLFRLQIKDWLRAIERGHSPLVPPEEGARSIALIEACYRERRLLELPWMRPAAALPRAGHAGFSQLPETT